MNEQIKTWLDNQHAWIQEAAYRILSNGELSEADIADFVEIIKSPPEEPVEKSYPTMGSVSGENDQLKLLSVGNIVGIDALSPRNPLTFGDGNLTVVYGDNGAGKSGYTRILTRACGKPLAKKLKHNLYQDSPPEQKCDIEYQIGASKTPITWDASGDAVDVLRQVDIFDTHTGRIYLESDTEVSYSPPELTLFADLVNTCKRVEAILNTEASQLVRSLPTLDSRYSASGVYAIYNQLSYDTQDSVIEQITTFTKEDSGRLDQLRKLVQEENPEKGVPKLELQIEQAKRILSDYTQALNATSVEKSTKLASLKEIAKNKRKLSQESAEILSGTSELEGVGSETWKNLWEAAKSYSVEKAYPEQEFPHTDKSRCVLCQQDLSDVAVERLESFNCYILGSVEVDAQKAEEELKKAVELLPIEPAPETLKTSLQAAQIPDELGAKVIAGWERLSVHLKSLRNTGLTSEQANVVDDCLEAKTELDEFIGSLNFKLSALKKDVEEFDIAALKKEGVELGAREWCKSQKPAIIEEVARLKKLHSIAEYKGSTFTAGISRKAGSMSETLLTDAYVERFNEELKELGASHIKIEIKKTSASGGVIKHGLYLKGVNVRGKKASEVLSEGENRIVALAAFLADVTGLESNSPFIFDDPITSLGQKFEEKTIDRLLKLSEHRQVLIFTHRLSFLGIMEDKTRGKFESVHIRREPWGTGETGQIPIYGKRTDRALNELINNRCNSANNIYNTEGSESYYPLAKAICSDFRIIMERIVEFNLLGDVVQRHRRAVNTMGKLTQVTKVTFDDCAMVDSIMTKYSAYEHSQSNESPVPPPGPDELLEDLNKVKGWLDEFSRRAV